MKKHIFIYIFIAAVLTMSLCLASCSNDADDTLSTEKQDNQNSDSVSDIFDFQLNEDGESYSLNRVYISEDTNFVIPATYQGKPVTKIAEAAFEGVGNVKSVTFPSSITSVASRAFHDCGNIENVYYTGNIEEWCSIDFSYPASNPMIPAENFYIDNKLLTDLVIPDSVTEIRARSFSGCDSITSITIHSNVTKIGEEAFAFCSSLKNITIPDSVTNIEDGAFEGCLSLKNVVLSNSLTTINAALFFDCSALESVTIGSAVTNIQTAAFSNCSSLTSIVYDGSTTSWEQNIDKYFANFFYPDNPNNWNGNTGSYVVYCSDGRIAKNGKVTPN